MKYIRTKNGIYEVKTKRVFNHIKEYKLGDTIEELCDEFHIEFESLSLAKEITYTKFYDFEIAKNNLEGNDTLYGVIHIKGKGLIYVAKMDNEGKLCLI